MLRLAKLLKHAADNGLTQAEIARRLGVTQPTISGWKTGYREPRRLEKAVELAKLLGCERVEELFEHVADGEGSTG